MRTLGILLVLLALAPTPGTAQPGPSVTFSNEFWPSQSVSNAEVGGASAALDGASVSTFSNAVALSYPLVFGQGRTVVVPRLGIQQISHSYEGLPRDLPVADEAYLADISLTLQHRLSSRWSLMAQISPAAASDLEGAVAREDFTLQGAAVAVWQVNPRFGAGLGAAYSTAFGAPIPLPVILLQGAGEAWRASALLPSSIEAWMSPSERLELGLMIQALGSRYHLGAAEGALEEPFAEAVNVVAGPSVNVRVVSWLRLGLDSGFSLYRHMRVTDGSDEMVRFEPGRTAFVRTRLTLGS